MREATEEDVPAVVDVYIRAYAQPPWNERHEPVSSEGYLRWVLSQPGPSSSSPRTRRCSSPRRGSCWPARETTLSSCGIGSASPSAPEGWPVVPGRLGYIWEIAVRPDRSVGGTALLQGAIERAAGQRGGLGAAALQRARPRDGGLCRFGFDRLPVRERVDTLSGPWVLPLHGLP